MHRKPYLLAIMLCLTAGLLASCSGSSSSGSGQSLVANSAPAIVLEESVTAVAGEQVILSAEVTDADGDSLELNWLQTGGGSLALEGTEQSILTFTAPSVAATTLYTFTLTASDGTDSASASVNVSIAPAAGSSGLSDAWLLNSGNERSDYILESDTGLGVLVNVLSAETLSVNGKAFTRVTANGIPDYSVIITQEILDQLNQRPRLDNDFAGGQTFVSLGDLVEFGQDIGYNSNPNCGNNAGYGYWPPGPDCRPSPIEKAISRRSRKLRLQPVKPGWGKLVCGSMAHPFITGGTA